MAYGIMVYGRYAICRDGLSRKFCSCENFGPGDQNSRKIGPPGPKYSEKFGPYSEKRVRAGLDFARARPISQCDSVEFYVEVCGEYEKTRKNHASILDLSE